MRALVLGSGAGGGVPQWNCGCRVCALAWQGDPRVKRRTETSVAISADGDGWIVLDAAPQLRQQIIDNPTLHPRGNGRHSPIVALVLTSGDVDHLAGLLCLREGHAFTLFGTAPTLAPLTAGSVFGVLRPALVERRVMVPEETVEIARLRITPFAVPGKVPLYREGGDVAVGAETEEVVGLEVTDGIHRLCYVPGVARLTPRLIERLAKADVFLLDGTTYTDDELPGLALATKTAGRMGHCAMTGEGGTIHAFPTGMAARKIYIHLNNSNPVLIEDSPERRAVVEAGWQVAHDGLEIAW